MERKEITLVATDLDGTFLNSEKEVPPFNRQMISRLKEKGILFGICSGRPIDTVRPMLRDWGILDSVSFIVGMNGGTLYDMRSKEKEDYHLVSGNDAIDVIHFFEDLEVEFYVLIGPVKFLNKITRETREEADSYGAFEVETDLESFLIDRDINKVVIWCKDEKMMPVVEQRAKEFHHENLIGYPTGPNYFEYLDPRTNKGFGLARLAKHYGTTLDHIMAFGDAENDREMLGMAGGGVCMKNGKAITKQAADHVTALTNDESAVGHFLEDYFFNEV